MTRWYSNRAGSRSTQSKPAVFAQPIKKPRATNAEELFAKEHKLELRSNTSSKLEQGGSTTPGSNLVVYHSVKKEAYSDLSSDERAKWEQLAKEHNERIKEPPTMDHIYE
jgi:hypothetical protein